MHQSGIKRRDKEITAEQRSSFAMGPRPPGADRSFNRKGCQNIPTENPNPANFCHPQFPQHICSQPAYTMNFPFSQFPHYPPYAQNFQYPVPPQYAPYSLPPPGGAMASPYLPAPVLPSKAQSDHEGTPHLVTGTGEQDADNAEEERTAKRLAWTEEEDIRLISAWLIYFKTDKYWDKVSVEYSSRTPGARKRELKHLKNRWQKIINRVAHFNDCWCQVQAKHPSVHTEGMQLMDETWQMYNQEARAMYLEETKRSFTFGHCWKAIWGKPKWQEYISSLCTKRMMRSESGDYMSFSEDSEDMPVKEIGEQDYMTSKVKASTVSSEVLEDMECLGDPREMKNREDMTEAEPSVSNQNLLLTSSEQPDTRDKENSRAPGFEVFINKRVAREDNHKKETKQQDCKARKIGKKRKGKASASSSDVQENIERAIYLQTLRSNDREKMSEVQLRLSKEQLELARIKQEEAKEKKEATLYKKYTELLLADTSRFDEFQKAEYEKAVKHIGGMLSSNDGN